MSGAPRSAAAGEVVRVLDSMADFARLEKPWDELCAATENSFFASHGYLGAWGAHFGAERSPRFVQVWRDGQLVAAAPLAIVSASLSRSVSRVRISQLQMYTVDPTAFNQWLVAPGYEDSVGSLFWALLSRSGPWSMADLHLFRHSAASEKLTELCEGEGALHRGRPEIESTVVDLAAGWEAYLKSRSAKFRKSLRNLRNKLAKREHRVLRETDGGEEVLSRVLALSGRCWKARLGTATGSDAQRRGFYERLLARYGPTGQLGLHLLEVEGRDVASLLSLRDRDTAYGMVIEFDESHARLGPGRSLVCRWLEDCASEGVRQADLLRRSSFLETFSDQSYPLDRVRIFPRRNLPSLWLDLEARLRPIGRSFRQRRRRHRKGRSGAIQG